MPITENSFELRFSQMSNTTLAEKVPSLADNRIGFQLVDKNDEETQAMGVSAYVVNDLYCYIPVFFIDGELRGTDLLYIYQRDVFVPSNDSWISMLKQEGVQALGKPHGNTFNNYVGKERLYPPEDVSTSEYNSAYSYKNASAKPGTVLHAPDVLNRMMNLLDLNFRELKEASSESLTLAKGLPGMGKRANHVFLNTVLTNPDFANACLQFHDADAMDAILKEAAAVYKDGEPEKSDVIFMTSNAPGKQVVLNKKEKRLLMNQGIYIKDTRTNFSKIYENEIDTGILQNPTEPGLYDVIMTDGTFETYVILFPTAQLANCPVPYRRHNKNTGRTVVLIDTKSPKKYYSCNVNEIYCHRSTKITEKETKTLQIGDKATQSALATIRSDKDYWGKILLVQTPTCSIETRITSSIKDDGEVYVDGASGGPYVDPTFYEGNRETEYPVQFVNDNNNLDVFQGCMYVPDGTRLFKQEQEKTLKLGAPRTIQLTLSKEATALPQIQVRASGETASITFNGASTGMLDKVAALKYLVLDHGIFAGTAQMMCKQAADTEGSTKTFRIRHYPSFEKSAYNMSAYGDSVQQPFNGGPQGSRVDAVRLQTDTKGGKPLTGPVDSDGASTLPKDVVNRAIGAADQGISEVFDVEVMKGLIEAADLSELRKNNLAAMVKGMDATGRLLFLFYWHKENFEEKYGASELSKLENTLKSVFQSQGDLILFLREKSIYNDRFSEQLFGALSEDLGSAAEV